MTVHAIDSAEDMEKLCPEWSDLYRRCPRATPFQSPQWLVPWTRHLFGGGEIWALAIRDAGELIGFAPLFRWGVEERRVSFLGAGISDYGDTLFAPGRDRECAAALRAFLSDCRDRWDALDLREIRPGSRLLEVCGPGWRVKECSVCPVLTLKDYPDSMDPKQRIDLRRAQNKLRNHSRVQFSTANEFNGHALLEEFFQLYEARWGAMESPIEGFHRDLWARFPGPDFARLCVLRMGTAPAAAIYAFAAGRTLYSYLSGYDPALAKFSPGSVLLAWLIEQSIAEGFEEVDFLRKPEAYKYLWGARDRVNYRVSGRL